MSCLRNLSDAQLEDTGLSKNDCACDVCDPPPAPGEIGRGSVVRIKPGVIMAGTQWVVTKVSLNEWNNVIVHLGPNTFLASEVELIQ